MSRAPYLRAERPARATEWICYHAAEVDSSGGLTVTTLKLNALIHEEFEYFASDEQREAFLSSGSSRSR